MTRTKTLVCINQTTDVSENIIISLLTVTVVRTSNLTVGCAIEIRVQNKNGLHVLVKCLCTESIEGVV
jgi:hypothetical protein